VAPSVVDLDLIRTSVDSRLTEFLVMKAEEAAVAGHPAEVVEALRGLVFASGKRLRPVMCTVGWHAAGGVGPVDPVLSVATAVEMFVAFALIHDDIMDRSDTRRGQPAVHRALAARHHRHRDAEHLGTSGALLVGDMAVIWSQELLHTAGLEPGRQKAVHGIFDRMLADVIFGQYRDLLGVGEVGGSVETALEVIRYKTATGTVSHPLQLGAAVAGASPALMEACDAFGLPLGEAFQLRDDLLGVFGSPTETGKPAIDDLREGKRTVLLALAVQQANQEQLEVLQSLVGAADLDEVGADRIRAVLEQTGARAAVESSSRPSPLRRYGFWPTKPPAELPRSLLSARAEALPWNASTTS
jgi:geranylgeranyl diphosphate synthase type I